MCSSKRTVYAQHGLNFHVFIISTFEVLNYDCISPAPVPPTIALLHHKWLKGTHKLLGTKQPHTKSHFQRHLEDESCPPLAGTVITKEVLVQASSCVLYDWVGVFNPKKATNKNWIDPNNFKMGLQYSEAVSSQVRRPSQVIKLARNSPKNA